MSIKGAYLEGVNFLKKYYGLTISVSAAETIAKESSVLYRDYYDLNNSLPKKEEGGELTVVSFDGKGIPMIKRKQLRLKEGQERVKKDRKRKRP